MGQEAVRENNQKQFINSAEAVDTGKAEGLSNAKETLLGSKSRYRFTCQSCKSTSVTTDREYESSEGAVKEGISREVKRSLRWQLSYALRSIPYIGYFLSSIVYSAVDSYNQSNTSSDNKGKSKAFEEIEPKFHRCKTCGSYLCNSCHHGDTCDICTPNA